MDERTLGLFDTLGRALLWCAVAVLGLSVLGAVAIISSDDAVILDPEVQRQGRVIVAIATFGGGLTAAGALAGLGAVLRLKVAEHMERRER